MSCPRRVTGLLCRYRSARLVQLHHDLPLYLGQFLFLDDEEDFDL
jgi:hypothetical protein